MKNKNLVVRKMRLWKSLYTDAKEALEQLDGKKNCKVEGDLLNEVENKEQVVYEDLNLTEEDLIIVELPKQDGSFPFIKAVKVEKVSTADLEESKTPTVTDKNNILK